MRECQSRRVCRRYFVFFFQAEDGIRDLVRSRGLGDVYKRQVCIQAVRDGQKWKRATGKSLLRVKGKLADVHSGDCLLYTSDAADERSSVDLGGRRIIKKKTSVCRQRKRVLS